MRRGLDRGNIPFPAVVVVSDKEICSAVVIEPFQRFCFFYFVLKGSTAAATSDACEVVLPICA